MGSYTGLFQRGNGGCSFDACYLIYQGGPLAKVILLSWCLRINVLKDKYLSYFF